MVDMAEINKRFDIHEISKNKLAEIEKYKCSIYCCHSTGCKSSGSDDLIALIDKILEDKNLKDKIRVVATGCMGLCAHGPLIRVEINGKPDILFKRVNFDATRAIMEKYVIPGLDAKGKIEVAEELKPYVLSLDLPFFKKQEKVVLKNAGHIDPEDITEYMAHGGYLALEKALKTMTPQQVVEEIKKSGLRGRGGGGFSTGMKWELAAKVPTVDEKFIICNGDEGDPGAYMDRSILEGDPHAVIEDRKSVV